MKNPDKKVKIYGQSMQKKLYFGGGGGWVTHPDMNNNRNMS